MATRIAPDIQHQYVDERHIHILWYKTDLILKGSGNFLPGQVYCLYSNNCILSPVYPVSSI